MPTKPTSGPKPSQHSPAANADTPAASPASWKSMWRGAPNGSSAMDAEGRQDRVGERPEDFLAKLAHEVRNPLAPIANAVAVLHGVTANEPVLHWVHDVIRRQVIQLTRVVDDLLDASRVTTGKISLHIRPLPINRIVDQAVEASRPVIDQRNQRITVSVPPEGVFVEGDLNRLAQALGNLLTNASKYTQDGGIVALTVVVEENTVAIRVTDNGTGISPEALPHIFELFSQDVDPQSASPGGLGIGLTVARSIVALHGGTLQARSEGKGRGSELTMLLPRSERATDDTGPLAWRAEAAPPPSRYRVTLIDDNADANAALGMMLQQVGHEVTAALTGLAGIELVRQHQPHVVLCDIGLTGMDGYAVAARLRLLALDPRPTLVAITGYGMPEDRARAFEAGFDHHLVKPVDPETLLKLIALTGARGSQSP